MATTLANLQDLINDRRRDSSTNSVNQSTDGFRAITSTLELMQLLHDWEFTIVKSTINFQKGITWYALPSNFKCVSDLRFQKPPGNKREFAMVSPNNFDAETTKTHRFAISTLTGTQRLRIQTTGDSSQLNATTTYNGDGTWVASNNASNVSSDAYEFYDLNGSVKFDLDGTIATLTNSTMNERSIAKYIDRGDVYMNFYLPTVTLFSSITIRVGSDSTNYWASTETTDYLGATPSTGWNKFGFNIFDTKVGSPNSDKITYIQVIITYSGSTTATGFRIENCFVTEDIPLDLIYYSTDMVYDTSASARVQNFISANDTTDYPLWSGKWDFVTESFVNAVLELIFWMTGETEDKVQAEKRRFEILELLKRRLPSRKRYAEMQIYVNV